MKTPGWEATFHLYDVSSQANGSWKGMSNNCKCLKGIALALLCVVLVLLGVIAWLAYHYVNQPQCQNQTISLWNDQLNQLQKENANLTATLIKYQTQFKQCKSNLTRIKEQLTEELAECQVKRKKCVAQLNLLNLSTVHRVHGCWIVLSTFCFMLLLN